LHAAEHVNGDYGPAALHGNAAMNLGARRKHSATGSRASDTWRLVSSNSTAYGPTKRMLQNYDGHIFVRQEAKVPEALVEQAE